ncbi:MAG: hypothetical protein CSYNP_01085 [Syntrophus sp. SKADARSKE-3]|nr:hypothetical protein [Syntrophus sp. SKADARSKE-3]
MARLNRSRVFASALCLLCLLLIAGSVPAQSQIQIKNIEVNQVLGVQNDGNQNYVAGKHTVVRAFLGEVVTVDPTQTMVNVSRNKQYVFTIKPRTTTGPVSTVDFQCDSLQACGNWSAGTYNFQVTVNGTAYVNNATNAYTFTTGKALRILAVAVKANYGSKGIVSVTGDVWKQMGKFMQNVYPLAEKDLKWTVHPTVFDASAAQYNLEKSDWSGCKKLNEALVNLIPASCATKPDAAGCYDFVVGIINNSIIMENGDILSGFAYPGTKAVVAVASDNDAPGTIAHEIAHMFGIGDTYDDAKLSSIRCTVNPAPDGFKGKDWDNNMETVTSCTAGRLPSTLIGSDKKTVISAAQVPAAAHPYEITDRGALPEMVDFMGASGALQSQMWITQDNFDWLFRRLVKQEAGLSKVKYILTASDSTQRYIAFSGTLSKTGDVEISPWRSYTDTVTLADTAGSRMVRAVNRAGAVLATTAFTVQFFMVHPPRTLDSAPFSGVIRFPPDTAKFQIVQNGQVLAEVPVSGNPPFITNVTPRTTTTIDGLYTISWQGGDADGTKPIYTVLYNRDVTNAASPWLTLVEGLTASSWREDFSLLPGGAHAKIQVIAEDGVLSIAAESAEFIVPVKKPQIFLEDPPWGTVYKTGSDILLVGEAYDTQDEWLPDDGLKWTSNIAGELGYGSELLVQNLPAGRHVITLMATNSAGVQNASSVTVLVSDTAGGSSSDRCFIATAAFGSYLHPYVGLLRNFRDVFLLTTEMGKGFVDWYYRVSPPMANFIADSGFLKAVVRILLLPVVGFAALALQIGFLWTTLLMGAFGTLSVMAVRKAVQKR